MDKVRGRALIVHEYDRPNDIAVFIFSKPFTIIKSPIKKNKVSHSTALKASWGVFLAIIIRTTAPLKEITASPLLIKLFRNKPLKLLFQRLSMLSSKVLHLSKFLKGQAP